MICSHKRAVRREDGILASPPLPALGNAKGRLVRRSRGEFPVTALGAPSAKQHRQADAGGLKPEIDSFRLRLAPQARHPGSQPRYTTILRLDCVAALREESMSIAARTVSAGEAADTDRGRQQSAEPA